MLRLSLWSGHGGGLPFQGGYLSLMHTDQPWSCVGFSFLSPNFDDLFT